MTAPRRIVIAEDHAILREGLRSLLAGQAWLEIVGDAGDGRAAVALVERLRPELVLMDLSMPGMTGLEAIREILRRRPATRIVALTVHNTEEYVRAARDAGAIGYVLKDDSSAELLEAIRSALAGKPYLSAEVAALLAAAPSRAAARGAGIGALTEREREVMNLVAAGKRSRDIAGILGISAKTVEKHRASLMAKLGLHNAAEVATYAARKG